MKAGSTLTGLLHGQPLACAFTRLTNCGPSIHNHINSRPPHCPAGGALHHPEQGVLRLPLYRGLLYIIMLISALPVTLQVEHYITLSKACYDCPSPVSDCTRPHCVAADGVKKPITAVNRRFPGPSIQVWGYEIFCTCADSANWAIICATILSCSIKVITRCPKLLDSLFAYIIWLINFFICPMYWMELTSAFQKFLCIA